MNKYTIAFYFVFLLWSNLSGMVNFKSGYSSVNGINMYYEIHGKGDTLVLIHGGGSTIHSTFGRLIPRLSDRFTLIAVELQNHGRSGFRNAPETFEQDADDVAALLNNIAVKKASFLGFSNGGTTAMHIAIRHPAMVHKIILVSAACKREGLVNGFFEGMQNVTLANMPGQLKSSFLEVNPDTSKLQVMLEKDKDRMIAFKSWSNDEIKAITCPTLIITGDSDVVTPEHAVEMFRLITKSKMAIIPGTHGECIGEIMTHPGNNDLTFVCSLIEEFVLGD